MNTIKASALMLMGLLITSSAYAQPARMDPQQMAKKQTELMKKELDLSEEQLTQIEDLNTTSADQMKELRTQRQNQRTAAREQMIALRDQREEKLKEILSDDQWTSWVEVRQELRRTHRGDGHRHKRGPHKP